MADSQKLTNNSLTTTQQKLLEVLLNPTSRLLSVTNICKKANCSRDTYYKAFDNDEFVKVLHSESRKLVNKHLAQVVNTFVEKAQEGSFNHGKILLEMAGIHTDKLEQSGETKIKVTISDD